MQHLPQASVQESESMAAGVMVAAAIDKVPAAVRNDVSTMGVYAGLSSFFLQQQITIYPKVSFLIVKLWKEQLITQQ
jgi:hypothetical protein